MSNSRTWRQWLYNKMEQESEKGFYIVCFCNRFIAVPITVLETIVTFVVYMDLQGWTSIQYPHGENSLMFLCQDCTKKQQNCLSLTGSVITCHLCNRSDHTLLTGAFRLEYFEKIGWEELGEINNCLVGFCLSCRNQPDVIKQKAETDRWFNHYLGYESGKLPRDEPKKEKKKMKRILEKLELELKANEFVCTADFNEVKVWELSDLYKILVDASAYDPSEFTTPLYVRILDKINPESTQTVALTFSDDQTEQEKDFSKIIQPLRFFANDGTFLHEPLQKYYLVHVGVHPVLTEDLRETINRLNYFAQSSSENANDKEASEITRVLAELYWEMHLSEVLRGKSQWN